MKLNISQNEIASLPATMGQLNELVELDIHINKITSLPSTVGHLKNLQRLECLGNPLAEPGLQLYLQVRHCNWILIMIWSWMDWNKCSNSGMLNWILLLILSFKSCICNRVFFLSWDTFERNIKTSSLNPGLKRDLLLNLLVMSRLFIISLQICDISMYSFFLDRQCLMKAFLMSRFI